VDRILKQAPPLSTEPRNADNLLAGTESILPDDPVAEFAALEELEKFRALTKLKCPRKM
jgi:hypothetical protein